MVHHLGNEPTTPAWSLGTLYPHLCGPLQPSRPARILPSSRSPVASRGSGSKDPLRRKEDELRPGSVPMCCLPGAAPFHAIYLQASVITDAEPRANDELKEIIKFTRLGRGPCVCVGTEMSGSVKVNSTEYLRYYYACRHVRSTPCTCSDAHHCTTPHNAVPGIGAATIPDCAATPRRQGTHTARSAWFGSSRNRFGPSSRLYQVPSALTSHINS